MIFRRNIHIGTDKTVDLPPGHSGVRYAPCRTYCEIAFLFVLAVIVGMWFGIDYGIKNFGNDDIGKKKEVIEAIDKREEEMAWGNSAKDIIFLHGLNFSYHRLERIRQDAFRSQSSVTDAYRDAAQSHKKYLIRIIKGRDNTRFWLHFFCGAQLLFALIALTYSIFTGNLIGYDPKGERSLFLQAPLNIAEYISEQSSSLITIVGICGTFAGLTSGLSNITGTPGENTDLQPLFTSLSISFISSLSGITISVFTRLLQKSFETPLSGAASSAPNNGTGTKHAPEPPLAPAHEGGGNGSAPTSGNGDAYNPDPEMSINHACGAEGGNCKKLEEIVKDLKKYKDAMDKNREDSMEEHHAQE